MCVHRASSLVQLTLTTRHSLLSQCGCHRVRRFRGSGSDKRRPRTASKSWRRWWETPLLLGNVVVSPISHCHINPCTGPAPKRPSAPVIEPSPPTETGHCDEGEDTEADHVPMDVPTIKSLLDVGGYTQILQADLDNKPIGELELLQMYLKKYFFEFPEVVPVRSPWMSCAVGFTLQGVVLL